VNKERKNLSSRTSVEEEEVASSEKQTLRKPETRKF
jgi:hypothetical protein